jgi:thioredoxin 1
MEASPAPAQGAAPPLLTNQNFDAAMSAHDHVMVVFLAQAEEMARARDAFAELRGAYPSLFVASVDVATYPVLGEMFGVTATPAILLMREQIALYCEPGVPALESLRRLIDAALQLDMDSVRRELAEEKMALASLYGRRVCPTAKRGR